jgi:preprotein translocase subunit SecD
MRTRDLRLLIGILVVVVFSAWVAWPNNPGIHILGFNRDIELRQGLDLQGGMQVLLEADVPASQQVTRDQIDAARGIVENRVNGLGVTEPNVQVVGDRRILVELPGIKDPDEAVAAFKGTGLLEFIDTNGVYLKPGTEVKTTFGQPGAAQTGATPSATASPAAPTATAPTPTPTALSATPTAAGTPAAAAGSTPQAQGTATPAAQPTATPQSETVYKTVLTGKDLKNAGVQINPQTQEPNVTFEFNSDAAKTFADFTSANVGKYLAIVLDKKVISCPVINTAIPEGSGYIEGKFTLAEAKGLAVQLKYGALPIPLKVIERRTVGPTLGQDSVARSLRAGIIGLIIVLLFMLIYYRLPGLLADLALLTYAVVTIAIFKLVPVTLTLPGITGFLLSVGMAVDANILIFERMKEELRHGKSLAAAVEAGFDRAWTSIRDSNLSTLINCVILFWFGSQYGASAVKGFAVTLFLGVVVSMFTAITVTRTFMRATLAASGDSLREKHQLMGV